MVFGNILNKLTILWILLLLTGSVYAATVNIETCPEDPNLACITSIENLEVLGVYYDLTVHKGSFNNLFANPEDDITYWGNRAWASEAVISIGHALNALNPIPSKNDTYFVDSFFGAILHLPVAFSESENTLFHSHCVQLANFGPASWGGCSFWDRTHILAFATFLPATGPVPAKVSLPLTHLYLLLLQQSSP